MSQVTENFIENVREVAQGQGLMFVCGVVDPEDGKMRWAVDGDVEHLLALKEHITIDLYTRIQNEEH